MSLTSLAKLFGILSLSVQLSVALPQGVSGCSCNGNISDKGGGECKTEHEGEPFCYVNSGQCPDQQESSQSGWFWSKQACAPTQRAVHNQISITCTCNGKISAKGSGECKTTHEEKPFCYVNQRQCPDEQESSQSGWFWSKQACAPASNCTCNGNISEKGSGECKTEHEGQLFCYVDQGKCTDELESSQSGWFWSKQACALGTRSSLTRLSSWIPWKDVGKCRYLAYSDSGNIFDRGGCRGGWGGSWRNPITTPAPVPESWRNPITTPAPVPDPGEKIYHFNDNGFITCNNNNDCPEDWTDTTDNSKYIYYCRSNDKLCYELKNNLNGQSHGAGAHKLTHTSATSGQALSQSPSNGRCPQGSCKRRNRCCRYLYNGRYFFCPRYCY